MAARERRNHRWSQIVDDESVDVVIAALAGMFTRQSFLRAPPGLPTIRAFQAGQGKVARAWLAQRRGWKDATDA
jgi:hypothetical protein